MTERDLTRVLRGSVADVRLSPSARERILAETNGGYQMRHKWKIGLALVIAMLLMTAVAGAWSLSRDFFEKTAQLQYESGYYDDWNLEEKRGFVDIMAEYELIDRATAKELKSRSEDELDVWMAGRYGINGRTDVIGLTSIAEKELGKMVDWPNETWVWFNQIELRMGQLSSNDPNICVTPGEEAVPVEQAIEAAKEAIEADGGPTVGEMASAKAHWTYEIPVDDETRENARYYLRFELPDGGNVWAEVLRDGTVDVVQGGWQREAEENRPAADRLWDKEWDIEKAYREEHGLPEYFYGWPVEDKAAVAELWEPLYREAMLAGSEELLAAPAARALHAVVYTYGVPDEKALGQDEAAAIARGALTEVYGLPADLAELYDYKDFVFYYYSRGAGEEGHPAWEFQFNCTKTGRIKAAGFDPDKDYLIVVQVDAWTGTVLRCERQNGYVGDDPRVKAVKELLDTKGAPANWTDEEWAEYLPWPR